MKQIGFVGVGNMGAPMAMCSIRAGYELLVCDKRFSTLEKFKVIGVPVTEKPADCAQTEMVIIMVGDDSQVEETLHVPCLIISLKQFIACLIKRSMRDGIL